MKSFRRQALNVIEQGNKFENAWEGLIQPNLRGGAEARNLTIHSLDGAIHANTC